MMLGMCAGVSIAVALAVLRLLLGINIWFFLVSGIAIALALTRFTSRLFAAIAFDAGGVACGSMTAAFLLPFAVGICKAVGGNIMTGAKDIPQLIAGPRLTPQPYDTGVPGHYLCSAATPPGPGAHGMCGAHAAARALRHLRSIT